MMQIGDVILGRTVEDLIAIGGQGELALARDPATGELVVIKRLSVDPAASNYDQEVARFVRAGTIRIGHEAIVDPIEYAQEDGEHYIVFPYVEGVQLDAYLRQHGGRLSIDVVVALFCVIGGALEAVHAAGYVHRDLKPANILITPEGRPVIIDFGIARSVNEATITTGSGLIGSLHWMSPEQIRSPDTVDRRCDVYAAGVLLYYLLTGQVPVQGDQPGPVALSICQYIPPAPRQIDPSIPEHVDRACMKMLAKDPAARFQTAAEFAAALQQTETASPSLSCRSCGRRLEPDFRCCPTCGAPVATQVSQVVCLACGAPVDHQPVCPTCQRPFGQTNHQLTGKTGTLTGRIYRIPEGIFDVGRAQLEQCDAHISRRHLHVACLNGAVQVQDAGSANKTYVDGRPADLPTLLRPGQSLTVGSGTVTYNNL